MKSRKKDKAKKARMPKKAKKLRAHKKAGTVKRQVYVYRETQLTPLECSLAKVWDNEYDEAWNKYGSITSS